RQPQRLTRAALLPGRVGGTRGKAARQRIRVVLEDDDACQRIERVQPDDRTFHTSPTTMCRVRYHEPSDHDTGSPGDRMIPAPRSSDLTRALRPPRCCAKPLT